MNINIGKTESGDWVSVPASSFNRHGVIAGATGTGKTVSLKLLAESLSDIGVPVVVPDVKGDLSGLALESVKEKPIVNRVDKLGLNDFAPKKFPVTLWKLGKGFGHPLRTTVSEVGPLLLSRILDLNSTQTEVLSTLFTAADSEGLLLLDAEDLKALLSWAKENREELEKETGAFHPNTLAAIHRKVNVAFDVNDKDKDYSLLGEPALNLFDMIRTTADGKGVINILDVKQSIHDPSLYSTYLLWLLSELFEELPEVGNPEKPKLVFFFDEAHLLFDTASKALLEKIVTVVKLIRSKGVGVFFVTQHPHDIPEDVLAQLATRIQHGMRVYSPKEKKALRSAVSSMPENPNFNTYDKLLNLGTGEALISTLDDSGIPTVVEHTIICPPSSSLSPAPSDVMQSLLNNSNIFGKYDKEIDRESAAEVIEKMNQQAVKTSKEEEPGQFGKLLTSAAQGAFKSFVRSVGYRLGREITRGLLGSFRR